MQWIYSEFYQLIDHPALIFAVSFVVLSLATWLGAAVKRQGHPLDEQTRDHFKNILGSALTLNALIVGFTFSMAGSRFAERKNYEEVETNSIGTEYLRADLLPGAYAAKVHSLLRDYLDERIAFYKTRGERELREVHSRTAVLQRELWAAIRDAGATQPTPTVTLAIIGMNNVFDSKGLTEAAWLNRIPLSAWFLMIAIAVIGNLLLGYGAEGIKAGGLLLVVLPGVLSISFLLIADIESPRGGIIQVEPKNLTALAESLQSSRSDTATE
jgi:hypothetical protein